MEERSLEEEISARRKALADLRAGGRDPYPSRAKRSHTSAQARAAMGQEVSVAGRVRGRRGHGKMCFLDLHDEAGKIQVQFRKDIVGEELYEALSLVDLGDILGATGEVFETKTGEPTVAAKTWTILSKSLRPIPKWHGIEDAEIRYRKRHLDLAVDAEARARFAKRAGLVAAFREFFQREGFIEVETPYLHPIPGGAVARPFATHHNTLDLALYLRIAPELYLKRLLVGGFERVFEIGKSFRNEGIDRMHNPEFTMLEAYAAYGDYTTMMDLFERGTAFAADKVIGTTKIRIPEGFEGAGREVELAPPWRRVAFLDAIVEASGPRLTGEEPPEEIDAAFEKFAEKHLIAPTFVVDFPVSISPLAKRRPDAPHLAERFEPFLGGKEIGNAFSELNDPDDQRARFVKQLEREKREKKGEVAPVLDEDFLEALELGMPPAGGLGMGIDRIAMLLLGVGAIREVILFPTLRPPTLRPR